jgi:uncharacterized protein YndB with AHSA1/START domain
MQDTMDLGTYARRGDGKLDIRFERNYPRPVETVWKALTEPERLADWMGQSTVEPYVGGRFLTIQDSAAPMTGKVLVWEPPKTLEFSWSNKDAPDSVVRYELTADGSSATRLVFTQRGVLPGRSALMMPGWQWLFDRLANALEGKPGTQSGKSWSDWQQVYVPMLRRDFPQAALEGVE